MAGCAIDYTRGIASDPAHDDILFCTCGVEKVSSSIHILTHDTSPTWATAPTGNLGAKSNFRFQSFMMTSQQVMWCNGRVGRDIFGQYRIHFKDIPVFTQGISHQFPVWVIRSDYSHLGCSLLALFIYQEVLSFGVLCMLVSCVYPRVFVTSGSKSVLQLIRPLFKITSVRAYLFCILFYQFVQVEGACA